MESGLDPQGSQQLQSVSHEVDYSVHLKWSHKLWSKITGQPLEREVSVGQPDPLPGLVRGCRRSDPVCLLLALLFAKMVSFNQEIKVHHKMKEGF